MKSNVDLQKVRTWFLANRKVISIVAVLLVVVCVLGVNSASSTARSYLNDVKAWRQGVEHVTAEDESVKTFSELIVVDRRESSDELAQQKQACDVINKSAGTTLSKLETPQLTPNPFGVFSNTYKEASTTQQSINKSVEGISEAIYQNAQDIQNFCKQYIALVEFSNERDTAEAGLTSTFVPKGDSESYFVDGEMRDFECLSDNGCVYRDASKRAAFESAYASNTDKYFRGAAELAKANCSFEKLRRICDLDVKFYSEQADLRDKYIEAVKTADYSTLETNIDDASQAIAAHGTDSISQYKDLYSELFPDLDINDDNFAIKAQIKVLKEIETNMKQQLQLLSAV